ncbi:FkbM family methyltransferase [Candidatus Chloroploca sp. M-50]|uniref:FkbM family methyltransferase n=1 Tax=Candidatus Chloroploca mongolica TaxID=2528176 RepID=A0ABS4D8J9_9CHLR|nr:FkbM family methyltransferase [Candidatus Chloroploca mongolica]MBP1465729.1 FkbM family methyltransferase [Candidatus Chloroploca mongolica]
MNLIHFVRRQVKRSLAALGYEVRRSVPSGSMQRPVGDMQMLLEDLYQRNFAPTAILDVGANRASWSRIAKAVFSNANLFMIEPQVEMEPHLQRFCAEHPGSKYFLAGAGVVSGKMSLTISDDLAGSSFLPSASSVELPTTGRQRTVPIVTVDELISSNQMPVPQLAKLDVQGFELEALRGGRDYSVRRKHLCWKPASIVSSRTCRCCMK